MVAILWDTSLTAAKFDAIRMFQLQIEVGTFDKPTSVYIHGSYALCTNCLDEYKTKYPEEFQVEQTCVCCNEDGYKKFIASKEEEE